MKSHISNAAYGIADYAAYPVGMLIVAPVVLHNLGVGQFGIWTLATAAASTGGIIASGFGDANIQHLASQRGHRNEAAVIAAVRSMMAINLGLGVLLSILGWISSPIAASHMVVGDAPLQQSCLWSLRIASLLMTVRAMESVCISTQRAFERYGAAVRVTVLFRLTALAVSAGLTFVCHSVTALVVATGCITLAGFWLQLVHLKHLLATNSLMPTLDRDSVRSLFGFGVWSWLQAVAGVVFSQIDRLVLGASLGAGVVASYALCAQMAQPIFGLSASGLHFLFPYLSHRNSYPASSSTKRPLLAAFACNVIFVGICTVTLLLQGDRILRAWAGTTIAQSAAPVLTVIVWSSALLGLNVTATYALLALGRVQIVTWFNLAGGAVMLSLMLLLTPRMGIRGIAIARLSFALVPLLLYIPLLRHILSTGSAQGKEMSRTEVSAPAEVTP